MKTKSLGFFLSRLLVPGGWMMCLLLAAGRLAGAESATFLVEDGASPWHDRVGQWNLVGVPEELKGTGPLPQQNCSSRKLAVPGTPAWILVGVIDRDLSGFKKTNPAAVETGGMISVENGKGSVLTYVILKLEQPAPVVSGGSAGGLLLLGVHGDQTPAAVPAAPLAVAPASPPGPASAAVLPAPPQSSVVLRRFETGDARSLHIYLLMGQSNMVGRDTDGLATQTEDVRIGYIAADEQWWLAHEPMHDGGSGMGPGLVFARQMIRMNPTARIGLVPCAVGGSALKRWEKGGDLYVKALARAQAAAKAGVLKGLLWHQGETDASNGADAASYQTRLAKMLTEFRADLGQSDLPVVVGQLGDFVTAAHTSTVRGALASMPGQASRVAFVDSTGLTDKGDGLHFSAAAARELGIRYALVMRALQNGTGTR